jgi:hypothetical protein
MTLRFDCNILIEVIGADNAHQILKVLGINLSEVSGQETIDPECEWQCSWEKAWWPIRARQLNLTDLYSVRWTHTEEAGIDDIEIVEIVDADQDQESLGEWLREIAGNVGSSNGNVRCAEVKS